MALFDPSMFQQSSYNGGMGGGLLGYLAEALKQKAGGQPVGTQPEDQPTPVIGGAGNYPVPTFGQPQSPMQSAALPPTAQPAQYQPPQPPQQQPPTSLFGGNGGGIGDNLNAGLQGFTQAKSPMQAIGNLLGGLTTGARTDPVGMQQQMMMATYQALRQKGLPDADARAAALNPEILKTIAANNFDTKPKFGVIGQNQMGIPQYGFIRENQGTVTPVSPNGGQTVGGGTQIDPSLTGDDFLKAISSDPSLGPGKAQMVKAIAEGRQPYPSGFLLKTPFGQWLTTAVGQYEPGLDATLIGQRATFNKQMGSATPTSVGGQKTLMGTSLGHLAEVADRALDLNNSNGMGVAPLAHAYNATTNAIGTDAAAKANALNETVDRFSGEVGKLYSGSSGGGVSERESTRSRFGAAQSPQELAAGLEASRDLIKSKLAALENQQDQIFGQNNKNRVDFLGQNGRAALAKIDTAIAKLRGQAPPDATGASASAAPPSQTAINPKTGQRVMLKAGQWVPMQ